jgi:hypothetical protein
VKIQDDTGALRPFRYSIAINGKAHCFEPRPLPQSGDPLQLRHSMFGAALIGKLAMLTTKFTSHAQLAWEATLQFWFVF